MYRGLQGGLGQGPAGFLGSLYIMYSINKSIVMFHRVAGAGGCGTGGHLPELTRGCRGSPLTSSYPTVLHVCPANAGEVSSIRMQIAEELRGAVLYRGLFRGLSPPAVGISRA